MATKKQERWQQLKDAIEGEHTDRFNEILRGTSDHNFMDYYLKCLNYFKPRLSSGNIQHEGKVEIIINDGDPDSYDVSI